MQKASELGDVYEQYMEEGNVFSLSTVTNHNHRISIWLVPTEA